MKTVLDNFYEKSLYNFWRDTISEYLKELIKSNNDDLVLNLASEEYSSAIDLSSLPCQVVDVVFKENQQGRSKIIGLMAKRARGEMIDYCIMNNVTDLKSVRRFERDGYRLGAESLGRIEFVRERSSR